MYQEIKAFFSPLCIVKSKQRSHDGFVKNFKVSKNSYSIINCSLKRYVKVKNEIKT